MKILFSVLIALNLYFVITQTGMWPINLAAAVFLGFVMLKD
jgi:hypothetical protein